MIFIKRRNHSVSGANADFHMQNEKDKIPKPAIRIQKLHGEAQIHPFFHKNTVFDVFTAPIALGILTVISSRIILL